MSTPKLPSVEELHDWVQGKGEDEIVGEALNPHACLIATYLREKYPNTAFAVMLGCERVTYGPKGMSITSSEDKPGRLNLPRESALHHIAEDFDDLHEQMGDEIPAREALMVIEWFR